jgi:HAD superfamily phosphatase (TIGR01668 family)
MLIRPTYIINGDITDIDLDKLFADGVRALILDLDSTLVAPRSGIVTQEVADWLSSAKSKFKMTVLTNNLKHEYFEQVAAILQIPIMGKAVKPRRGGFLKAAKDMNVAPDKVAVVGDRPLTDILGGARAGMKTILVLPLKTMNESALVKYIRKLERLVIRN